MAAPVVASGTKHGRPSVPRAVDGLLDPCVARGPARLEGYEAPLERLPLLVRLSDEAIARLYEPLLNAQLQRPRDRAAYLLRVQKGFLLVEPARALGGEQLAALR